MGNLTTFTIYNDGLSEIKENPKDFANKIYELACGSNNNSGFNSVIIPQKTRHSSEDTLYLQSGNTVIDVFDAKSEWAVETFIRNMEYHLGELKGIKKNPNVLESIIQRYEDEDITLMDGFDDAVIGISVNNKLVYSKSKVIEKLQWDLLD